MITLLFSLDSTAEYGYDNWVGLRLSFPLDLFSNSAEARSVFFPFKDYFDLFLDYIGSAFLI